MEKRIFPFSHRTNFYFNPFSQTGRDLVWFCCGSEEFIKKALVIKISKGEKRKSQKFNPCMARAPLERTTLQQQGRCINFGHKKASFRKTLWGNRFFLYHLTAIAWLPKKFEQDKFRFFSLVIFDLLGKFVRFRKIHFDCDSCSSKRPDITDFHINFHTKLLEISRLRLRLQKI